MAAVSHHQLLFLLLAMAALIMKAASAAKGPKKLDFYMFIAVQNNSFLDNPMAAFTAVQSGQPPSPLPNSFGVIHSFDNPLTAAPDLDSLHVGRVQGWYGDVGQDLLTLLLVQTFTWDDGHYSGTFSLLGIDVAADALKYAPIVGGTGDFAFARGVAQQTLISMAIVNFEIVSWFHYVIHFKY